MFVHQGRQLTQGVRSLNLLDACRPARLTVIPRAPKNCFCGTEEERRGSVHRNSSKGHT